MRRTPKEMVADYLDEEIDKGGDVEEFRQDFKKLVDGDLSIIEKYRNKVMPEQKKEFCKNVSLDYKSKRIIESYKLSMPPKNDPPKEYER